MDQSLFVNKVFVITTNKCLTTTYLVCFQFGDYDEATFDPGMLATEDLLPQRVIDQYQMTPEMWATRIKQWYSDHRGMAR